MHNANVRHVDQVEMNSRDKANINYAKAREALQADAQELYKGNTAGASNFLKLRKTLVINHLGGRVVHGKRGTYVEFQDQSKAKF